MRAAARQAEKQHNDHLAVRRAPDQRPQPVREFAVGDRGDGPGGHQENEGEHSGELQESLLAHSSAATVFMPKSVMKAAPEQLRHQSVHEGA